MSSFALPLQWKHSKHITVTASQTTTDAIYLDASASAPAILPLILIAIAAGGLIAAALIAWWISTKKKRPRPPELAQSSTLQTSQQHSLQH